MTNLLPQHAKLIEESAIHPAVAADFIALNVFCGRLGLVSGVSNESFHNPGGALLVELRRRDVAIAERGRR